VKWNLVALGKRAATFWSEHGAVLNLICVDDEVQFFYNTEGSNMASGKVLLLPEQLPQIRGVKTSRYNRGEFRILRVELEVAQEDQDPMKLIFEGELKKRKE
jgi:hypothetical protein